MRRLHLALAAACVAAAAASPSIGQAQPVSGLYVGAAGGVGFHDNTRIRNEIVGGKFVQPATGGLSFKPGYVGLGSIGWGLGNGVRLELEGSARGNDRNFEANPSGGLSYGRQSARETKTGVMGNVLFDMDIGSPYIYPYLGAGAGYQAVRYTQDDSFTSKGVAGADHFSGTKGGFAYQAMIGASLPIAPVVGLSATVEYRFMGLSGQRSYAGSSTMAGTTTPASIKLSGNDTSQILVGLRYVFDVPPPASPAAAVTAAVPAPKPAPSRSYLVFFNWDRADLTVRAKQIVAQAASDAATVATTKVEVSGNADTTGSEPYNQALSLRRAKAVAGELVRLGVKQNEIVITANGDTQPLVPTGPGVREPQNRRVEIVLH